MRERTKAALSIALAALTATALAPASASAEIGPELVRFGKFGSGAGELKFGGAAANTLATNKGGGIATDPTSGHVFVSDVGNHRISEFTAWGEFVKAWGWGVADGSTAALQTCTATCFAGKPGAGVGQLDVPNGIALAPNGDLYVFERENHRVQAFDQSGKFVLMFGGGVNVSDSTDVCTAADVTAGDTCGAGSVGTGPSEFFETTPSTSSNTGGDYIDFGPDGLLYVGDRNRIQKFEADGDYVGSLPLPEDGYPGTLDVDAVSGDVYFGLSFQFGAANAYRLDENTGAPLYELPTQAIEGMATDPAGALFVSDDQQGDGGTASESPLLREIDPTGKVVESCCPATTKFSERTRLPSLTTNVVTAAGGTDLYVAHSWVSNEVAFVEVRGAAPDKWPPPPVPPSIDAQFATMVRSESAVVKAEINPNFWADTRYRLQLGTSDCSLGGCEEVIEEPGTLLGAGIVKRSVQTEGVSLTDLEPGTTYHYRFVASSGGGGPVFGADRTFTTYALPKPVSQVCPNADFRTGSSASLADCRAYEMVSPTDKAGGDILVMGNINGTPTGLRQATPDGQKITYTSYRSFADAESAPYAVQYIASRGEDGWSTDNISPPRDSGELQGPAGLDSQYKAFLEDLSAGWIVATADPILDEGAVPGYANLYRRDSATEAFDALTTVTPAGLGDGQLFTPELQSFSADGSHTVFRANAKLTKPAVLASSFQIYETFEGSLRLVSVKDDGKAATVSSTLGALIAGTGNGREANVRNAVSADGSKIYWGEEEGARKLYVRVDGADTFAVSGGAARYWAAKPDGSQALYEEAGALKLYDLAAKSSTTLVGSGVSGVVGSSEDLSRIYLVSTADLASGAQAGKPNLYLYEEGEALEFLGALAAGEANLVPKGFSPIAVAPRGHAATTTSDASTLIFMSRAPLSGADNAEVESEEPVAQVFRYDAEADELDCVSCNPTGARPVGYEPEIDALPRGYWVSGLIPGGEFQNHFPRSLSADGDRVFFESTDRLTISDTNGKIDVYAWEAPGKGECTPEAPGYNPNAGGCVTLISDGQGASGSELVDASSDGASVFFTTAVGLLPQDPGQVDLYAASEDGGFPQPPPPPAPCEGEACQPAATPPPASPFSSQTFVGPGNPPARKQTRRCRKGTVRKRGKCVRKGQGASKSSRSSRNDKRYEAHRATGGRG